MNAALPKLASESLSELVIMPIHLISLVQIKQAFSQAQAQQRRVIDVLEELNEQDQEAFLQSVSQTMHFDAISMREMNSLHANFEAIPFAIAIKKECLAFDSALENEGQNDNKKLTDRKSVV